ncbi:ABC transporter permease OS=Streptomyces cyaneofuscatus OX=66883 GN=G3I52_02335 PE=3 SV=1 [Streptomyces griseus subsp. griseus]
MNGVPPSRPSASNRTAPSDRRGSAPGGSCSPRRRPRSLGASAGDGIALGGTEHEIAAVATDASYSHTPVVWTSLDDWQRIGHDGAGPVEQATVIALTTTGGVDLAAGDAAAGTSTLTLDDSLTAIGSYQAENGSLQLMRGFLFAISALVIGAFFTVWTIQRSGDVAVLKALGASTPYLLRDALGQAVVMLALGTGAGTALAAGAGALIGGGAVPFVLDASTVLVPAAVLIALGALGAALSIRRITAVDPLTALGSAR